MAHHTFDYEHHMRDTKYLRNVCILAHVDHGKTTFSDSLIASNGIISSRDVGKVHYLDSREDEQAKQITMKSSCIALLYSPVDFQDKCQCFLINLIDSPGHVDFSAEVKSAVEISDGAFLIVDVVEGICAQTRSVMEQINLEQLCPCLVINKIDKLVVNLKLTPLEAYYHIYQLLEQINALMAGFITFHEVESKSVKSEKLEECHIFFFSPLKGNVIFASSLDGWGFSIESFALFFSDKLGYSKKILSKTLWGDFYISNKVKRVLPNAQSKGKWPLFATLILDTIWSIYHIAFLQKDLSRVDILVRKLGIEIHSRDLKSSNNKHLVQSILTQWLPLPNAALNMAVYQMPGPQNLCNERIERLLTNYIYQSFSSLPIEVQALKPHFLSCSPENNVPQIAYISKMMYFSSRNTSVSNVKSKDTFINHSDALPKIVIRSARPDNHSSKDYLADVSSVSDRLIGITRVFSGTLYNGQYLYVLHPQYDPRGIKLDTNQYLVQNEIQIAKELPPNVSMFQISMLYILLGGELIEVDSVPAGNICGVSGLDNILLRNGTLSNTLYCIPFTPIYNNTTPILKVALEPVKITELDALIHGINLLVQADPCVQTAIEESGERVIYCAGEVHLQKCIEDLSKYFAIGIDFDVSAPIIPFRETIISNSSVVKSTQQICDKIPKLNEFTIDIPDEIFGNSTPNKQFEIALRVCPMPSNIVQCLDANTRLLKLINLLNTQRETAPLHMDECLFQELTNFKCRLNELFFSAGKEWINAADKILSFGPKMIGPNVLLNNVPEYPRISIWQNISRNDEHIPQSFDSSIIQGFQLATLQGPLCHEPLVGVCVFIESYKFNGNTNSSVITHEDFVPKSESSVNIPHPVKSRYGPFSGQIISTVIKTCKQALASQPVRLMLAMFSCSIQCSHDVLGSVMAVINRRGGKCFDSNVQVGTNLFSIETYIPIAESLGFSDEIRKRTSGLAIPQLVFSHWEVLNDDPFWIPTTNEELLHFGEKADSENIAKKYVDSIRRRKGLIVKANIVESAEKQRTVKK